MHAVTRRVLALVVGAAGVSGCDDGMGRRIGPPDARPGHDSGGPGGGDYTPQLEPGWSGCPEQGGSVDCDTICASRLLNCRWRGSAQCPGAWLNEDALGAICTEACETYPTFPRLACGAETCDGFYGLLRDTAVDGGALCDRIGLGAAESATIETCTALDRCLDECPGTQGFCIQGCREALPERLRPYQRDATDRLSALAECTEGCEGSPGCPEMRCRPEYVSCFGGGEPLGEWDCSELMTCLASCPPESHDCAGRCVEFADPDSFALYSAVRRCAERPRPEPSGLWSDCGDELAACRYDRIHFGTGDCSFLADCTRTCETRRGSGFCERACRAGATREANVVHDTLLRCVEDNGCPPDEVCRACAEEYRACQEG